MITGLFIRMHKRYHDRDGFGRQKTSGMHFGASGKDHCGRGSSRQPHGDGKFFKAVCGAVVATETGTQHSPVIIPIKDNFAVIAATHHMIHGPIIFNPHTS